MKKTMKDLAEELGISRTTVSLVLKGKGDQYRISRETQEKILALVKERKYKPNFFAQGLNRNSTRTIGIVFPDVFEEFMVEMIRGIGEVLTEAGYTMILMTSRFRREIEKKNLEELIYRGTDGILMVPTCGYRGEKEDQSHLKKPGATGIPMVMTDRIPAFWEGPSILQDDRAGGFLAADYLKRSGCSRILTVSLDLTASSIRERQEGFASVLPRSDSILLKQQNSRSVDLKEALEGYVSEHSPSEDTPLGIFVTTAGLAIRVRDLLEEKGFSLNREFRIIRFGRDPEGYRSGMAGIIQPHYEMGRRSASILLDMIEDPERSTESENLAVLPDFPDQQC